MLPPLMDEYKKKNGKLHYANLKQLSTSCTQFSGKMKHSTCITGILDIRKEKWHS
jgi:hypothetical protein